MTTTDARSLAEEVARHYWWHSIDLGNGVVTPGHKTPAVQAAESGAFFDRVDLNGRSVIDIGAWNGFYSFEAKRRGAARVLATDSFTWSHKRFRGRETFEFARRCLQADVDMLESDICELTPERVGHFDVVLLLGVFYHLHDPIEGLRLAARLANEVLIVETALDLQDVGRPAMAFYPGSELNNDPTNWWGPNPSCMVALLQGLGFTIIDAVAHPSSGARGVFHAWRSRKGRLRDPAVATGFNPAPAKSSLIDIDSLSRGRKLHLGWRLIRRAIRGA